MRIRQANRATARCRTPSGVEEDAVELGQIDRFGPGMSNLCVREWGEVECCQRSRDLVDFYGRYLEPERRKREGIGAQTASEVGDACGFGVAETAGVMRGYLEARCLCEAILGEQHVVGEVAEFCGGAAAELELGEDDCAGARVGTCATERCDRAECVPNRVELGVLVEQAQ